MGQVRARHIETSGGGLYVEERGAGDAVILIHGIPTNGHLWDEVAPALASEHHVVVVDLVGYGRSTRKDRAPVDVEHQATYLLEAMDAMGLARAALVAHDIGGAVAQVIAVDHPGRATSLLLINAVSHDTWPVPAMRRIASAAWLLRWMPVSPVIKRFREGLREGFSHPRQADRAIPKFLERFGTRRGLRDLLDHASALDAKYTRERSSKLGGLGIPIHLVWGTDDQFQPVANAERLAEEIEGARLIRLPGVDHFSPADAPGPVVEAIRAHLRV